MTKRNHADTFLEKKMLSEMDILKEKMQVTEGANLDNLIQKLPGCSSRDLINQLTDQMNLETKIRNIRFIGELCKFKIAPSGLFFKCLKVHRGKYSQVHLIALLNAGLSHYHEDFAVAVVDETLYLIIVFGHGKPERDQLDPPEDFFRIRLITTLLQTCGRYFDRGSSKRKLHGFLLHFQRYVLSKGPLPLDVEFDVQPLGYKFNISGEELVRCTMLNVWCKDLFAHLGSNMTRYSSMEELSVALIELEANKYVASAEKCGSDWHPGSKEQMKQSDYVSFDANRKSLRDRTDENGKDNEEAGSESYSSGSIYQDGHEDTDFPSEGRSNGRPEEDDNGDDNMPVGSDEEIVHVKKEAAQVDPNEQEDFDRGLKALLQESLESRKLELRAKPTLNMVIPMNVFERAQSSKRLLSLRRSKTSRGKKILEYNEREEEELNRTSLQTGDWGQGGNNLGSSIRSAGRGSWDAGSNRRGGARRRYHITGGFNYGYGRSRDHKLAATSLPQK
uniref:MIF4G domain-containing protein n=1 Tax=Oryza punctata TaxID=4537 RepID=A0A0E0KSY0_ORYPU